MPLLSLDLKLPSPENAPVQLPSGSRSPRFTLSSFDKHVFPIRGFLLSLLFHEIAVIALMFLPPLLISTYLNRQERTWEATMLPKDEILYLPNLGGGKEGGSPKKAGGGGSKGGGRSPAPATNMGLTYAGPQKIVSNPPNPTNHIQTILQPDLPKPPVLKTFVPLPNIIALAQAPPPPPVVAPPKPVVKPIEAPPQPVPKKEPQVVMPVVSVAAQPTIETPKLTLPMTPTNTKITPTVPSAPAPPAPITPPPKVAEVKPAVHPPQALSVGESKYTHNLLALNPIPVPANVEPKVPQGEARGQFAISPQATSDPLLTGAGSGQGTKGANSLALGVTSGSGAGDAIGGGTGGHGGGGKGEGAGSGAGPGMGGTGKGSGAGTGSGGPGGGGGGGGTGTGIGPGTGHGTGSGHGTGTGTGAGPGGGPFAGMTIQGAEGPAGGITISGTSNAPPKNRPSESYGLTIVSTGNSGGGVGDFGVFRDEAVFTVYLNPSKSADDPAPPWSLQYAVLGASGPLQDLVPPYPMKKDAPVWTPDLVAKYSGQEVVVFAEIDTEGNMRKLKVLRSPNAGLSEGLIIALNHWVFRPATMNGQPVAVKAVLGIPISTPR